jgi:hypothetical protein
MQVSGSLLLPADAPTGRGRVLVEVREIGPADAPSSLVAEQVQENMAVSPRGRLSFSVNVSRVDARRHYGLRAHVDMDGDGRVGAGDLLSTISQPVLTFGGPDRVDLPLSLVAGPPSR